MNRRHAFLLMLKAHAGVDDKVGEPYIFHPLAVEEAVAGLGEDFAVVALLHDVFEDTPLELVDYVPDVATDHPGWLTYQQAAALKAITHLPSEPHDVYMLRVADNFIASVVKWADMNHNMHPERREGLDETTAKRMEIKYERGRAILLGRGAP